MPITVQTASLCDLRGFSEPALRDPERNRGGPNGPASRLKAFDRKGRKATAKGAKDTKPARFPHLAAVLVALTPLAALALAQSHEPTIDELKARIASASIRDRPPLCIQLSEQQLGAASRFYNAGESEQAKTALTDVVAFSELARDYSIQSHKHEKQSEIAIRKMIRRLNDLKHTVTHDEQEQVQNTIDRLQRIRDDLLAAMFPKGVKP